MQKGFERWLCLVKERGQGIIRGLPDYKGQRAWKETMGVDSVGPSQETTVFIRVLQGVSSLPVGKISERSHFISDRFQA